jgi:hypothetical protein
VAAPLVMGGKPSSFGMDIPLLRRCAESLTGMGFLRLRGLHARRLRAGDLVAFGLAGVSAWNISHHSFLMHPPPAFIYQGQLA